MKKRRIEEYGNYKNFGFGKRHGFVHRNSDFSFKEFRSFGD